MKKNILLVLLSAALLTGCEFDITLQRLFSGKKKEQETQQNNENSQEKPQENQQSNENQGGEQPGNEGQEQGGNEQNNKEEYTVTIKTSGSDFSGIATQAGVQMDDSNYSENAGKLKTYFESKLEHENLLTAISCTKLNTAVWKNVCYLCVGTGYFANDAFQSGIIHWTSGKSIYKVEIKAMAYAKEYNGGGFGLDSQSHIWIDSDNHSLETNDEPTIQYFSKEYANGTSEFEIKSTGSRVLLESITITWGL